MIDSSVKSLCALFFPGQAAATRGLGFSRCLRSNTVIAAELLHGRIERPGIARGSWLARRDAEGLVTA